MQSIFKRSSNMQAMAGGAANPGRRIRWLALGHAILALGLAPQAFAAPFQCAAGDFYQIRGSGTNTVVSTINRGVVPYTLDQIYQTSPLLNALGYNPIDNYLYAISSGGRGLYRLGASSVELSNIAVTGIPTGSTMDAGTFDLAGNYFVALNDGTISRIDGVQGATPSPVAVSVPRQADTAAPPGYTGTANGHLLVGDWAVSPLESTTSSTVIYGLRSPEGGVTYLYRVRIVNPGGASPVAHVSRIATTGLVTGNAFGTIYMDLAGTLYAYKNDASTTTGFYSVNVATGAATAVSGSAATTQSDGANCLVASALVPPTLVLRKTTANGVGGPFAFTLTNTGQTVGTVTTTATNTPVQVDGDTANTGVQPFTISAFDTAVTITESGLPAAWNLTGVVCTSGGSNVGSLAGATYTIPANAVVSGAQFECTFTNTQRRADLSIAKTSSNAGAVAPGDTINYTLVVTNHAGDTVTGAVVTDTPVAGLNCPATNAVNCTSTASPSACPSGALTVGGLLSSGITLGALPSTSPANTATFTFDCTVTATGQPVGP